MAEQLWNVAVSPAQRWVLYQLSNAEGQKLKGQRGRVYRRFLRALAIDVFTKVLAEGKSIYAAATLDYEPRIFAITEETRDYILDLLDVERIPAQEFTLGPLWDALEDIKKELYVEPKDVSDYTDDTARWKSPPDDSAVDAATKKICDYLRKQGFEEAAAIVEKEGWDTPEEPTEKQK